MSSRIGFCIEENGDNFTLMGAFSNTFPAILAMLIATFVKVLAVSYTTVELHNYIMISQVSFLEIRIDSTGVLD